MRLVRQPRPASACSSPYSGSIWCSLTGFLPISAAASIYLFKPPYGIGSVPSLSGQAMRTDGVHCRGSAGTGPLNLKVVPVPDLFSHTHYWYEVGMLKQRCTGTVQVYCIQHAVQHCIQKEICRSSRWFSW